MTFSETADPPRVEAGPVAPAKLGYVPALDGLRALAVMAVLCFHNGFPWARGGFLGVSLFFTLSGFLITTLILQEHERHGTIGLRAFYGRRLRRLMPASLLCLAGVVVFGATVATVAQQKSLTGDVWAALANVANWRMIFAGHSYADLFAAPSPVEHFWSLAIEEQFYWVMPVLMLGLLALTRGRRVQLGIALGAMALASTIWCAVLVNPGDVARVYYGTDTRAAELLIGCLLAVVLAHRPVFAAAARRWIVFAGVIVSALTLWVWHGVASTDVRLFRGGLAVYAVGSCVIIVAAMQPAGFGRVLGLRPLVALGMISYGVYLFHWPIFLWLSPARTGLGLWPLFFLRFAVTLAVAVVSYLTIETAIRRPGASPAQRMSAVFVGVAAAIAMVWAAVASSAGGPGVSA